MELPIEKSWKKVLKKELKQQFVTDLLVRVESTYASHTIYPQVQHVFEAFTLCPFEKTNVVILGQDPYHGPKQAHGLAFSVSKEVPTPPSLKNIQKEIISDIGVLSENHGNLEHWAKQGVLLLNSTLTVEAHKAGSHQNLGWEQFTDAVIRTISHEKEHVVFLLWGSYARSKKTLIDTDKHLILEAPHPSPLSAYRGFFGCKHFSRANDYLLKIHKKTINW